MAHLLVRFDDILEGPAGIGYRPRACGQPCADGRWEGWLEFVPATGDGPPLCTSRETAQPSRSELTYWAEGLTRVFLEGALRRARPRADATDDGPTLRPTSPAPPSRAVLNPFDVYAQGEDLLRQELRALSPMHLRNVLLAYELTTRTAEELSRMDARTLAYEIVQAVRMRIGTLASSTAAEHRA